MRSYLRSPRNWLASDTGPKHIPPKKKPDQRLHVPFVVAAGSIRWQLILWLPFVSARANFLLAGF